MITEKEVFEYRELYYEYLKPILYNGVTCHKKIEELLAPALNKFGWNADTFSSFLSLDFMQRIAKMKSETFIKTGVEPNICVKVGNEEVSAITLSMMLELKCPIRTTQKD